VKTQISKWGNSLAVRIPKPIAEAAKLRTGDALTLDVDPSGVVKISKTKLAPALRELVLRITVENGHSETDWGLPVGKERW
jgi:antitoxin MazE